MKELYNDLRCDDCWCRVEYREEMDDFICPNCKRIYTKDELIFICDDCGEEKVLDDDLVVINTKKYGDIKLCFSCHDEAEIYIRNSILNLLRTIMFKGKVFYEKEGVYLEIHNTRHLDRLINPEYAKVCQALNQKEKRRKR